MHSYTQKKGKWLLTFFCSVAVATLMAVLSAPFQGYAAKPAQKTFASPEDAVKAFIEALKTDDTEQLKAIFGPAGKAVLSSGDAIEDKASARRFLKAYEEKNTLLKDGDAKAVMQIGAEEWPFPIPIVQMNGKWFFDTKKGKEELINRRIGRNELNTLQACLAYVDAQREYALQDQDKDGLFEYAQKFLSTPGKKDGLYWEAKSGEAESPLGEFVARASSEGYKRRDNKPLKSYHGYSFKILKAQGNNASGGAQDYVVNGKMIGGFGMVAYPAQYGNSGIMTFIVNHEGVVYEKNLGKNTSKIARSLKLFNPDKTWKRVGMKGE